MDSCIFCKIVNGEIPSKKIYENDYVYSFLDISPQSKGHVLVIPKKHSRDIYEIDDDILCEVMKAVKKLSVNIKEKLNPEGLNIVQNSGKIAGQSVFHFHVHIIPRYKREQEYDIDEVTDILRIKEL